MVQFIMGIVLIALAIAAFVITKKGVLRIPKVVGYIVSPLLVLLGVISIVISTAIYVEDNQGGIIVRKFGNDLKGGAIIATDGEKGPQAYVLPPGWHFGYWPWLFVR